MSDEIMGKRTNGSGGSGSGDGGSDGTPPLRSVRPRSGTSATVALATRFRDHFDSFVEAGYRIAALEGTRGISARRQLADRLRAGKPLIDDAIALLEAEIIDLTRASALNGTSKKP